MCDKVVYYDTLYREDYATIFLPLPTNQRVIIFDGLLSILQYY